MTYSIILPTLNRAELIKSFLLCIQKQTILPYEIIVVDQSDNEATRVIFEQWEAPGIKKKYLHRSVKSLILARHAGLDACDETDLVAFFDDDIILDSLFCEEIVKILNQDKEQKYAGGMGTIDGWSYRYKPLQAFFLMPHEGDGRFLISGMQTFPHWKREFAETEFLSGGCTFWRRQIISKYRFDERLSETAYGDDVDVSYRISREHKLFFQPKALCYQIKNPPGRYSGRKYRSTWVQNMYYLVIKNKISVIAFAWSVFGHVLQDFVCLDFQKLRGDIEGISKVICGRLNTVIGFEDFKRQQKLINREQVEF